MEVLKKIAISIDLTESNDEKNLTGNQLVDKWELKAAKRISANLRTLLFEEAMLKLIEPQILEADERIRTYYAQSNGDFNCGQIVLKIKGVKSKPLFAILREIFMNAKGTPELVRNNVINFLFPVHPEHYALAGGCVETMGGIPTLTFPKPLPTEQAPDFIKPFVDKTYSICSSGEGPLKDGTPFTYVLQQFKDTNEGMEANLMIWYPAGCPNEYVEEHLEHYAVEFTNGCKFAVSNL